MTPERWRQIDEIFQLAAEQPPESRASVLDARCAGDAELRREVESLLNADSDSEAFVASKFTGLSVFADIADGTVPAGGRAGEYRIGRMLGSGGMGSVYLAERDDGEFQQQVAIKLVHGGPDSGWAKSRFKVEREILARLNHPNIARLLGGGTTANGAPYLVMEYVNGKPLQVWLAQDKPHMREMLRVFISLCNAVAYAHRNLIVHRDIKPGNILIQADGVPKLLDFGISKPIDPDGGSPVTLNRAMTPAYASPEQIRGEFVSTSTDVYSLGAILYEALAGRPPFDLERTTPAEAERAICENEPPAIPGVPADLAKIALKAMHKSTDRRYSSAENLADDIRCFLDGRPVKAQRDSIWYRGRKFVARHRALVLLSATAVILATALSVSVVLTVKRRQRAFGQFRDLARATLLALPEKIEGRGAEEIRLEIAESFDRFADPLAREFRGETGVIREIALGYEKLGLVLGIGDARSLGNNQAALANFYKAIQLVEPLRGTLFGKILEPKAIVGSRAILGRSHCNVGRLREFAGDSPARDYQRCLAVYESILNERPEPGAPHLAEYLKAHILVGGVTPDHSRARAHFEIVARIAADQQAKGASKNRPLLWESEGLWHLWRLDRDRVRLEAARRAITEARSRDVKFDVDARLLELRIIEDSGNVEEARLLREALRQEFPKHPLVRRVPEPAAASLE